LVSHSGPFLLQQRRLHRISIDSCLQPLFLTSSNNHCISLPTLFYSSKAVPSTRGDTAPSSKVKGNMFLSTALICLISSVAASTNPGAEADPDPVASSTSTSAVNHSSSRTSASSTVSTHSSVPTSVVPPGSRTYVLKTNSSNPAFSNLYLESYHSGAGTGDAVLVPGGSKFNGFLNGTYQEFDFGNPFPWGIYMIDSFYGSWFPVQINVGHGSAGFYFNDTDGTSKTGLKWVDGWPYQLAGDKFNEWNGWLGECSRESYHVHCLFSS
jgi:hypothetical protein